jgi:predicted nucleotidyltransferase
LLHAIAVYRKYTNSLSNATESFVLALQQFSDCVPSANIKSQKLISDLDFLIDSSQLLANSHSQWSNCLKIQVEEPLIDLISLITQKSIHQQEINKSIISKKISVLNSYNESNLMRNTYKNLNVLSKSLNCRLELTNEIQRLNDKNATITDKLTKDHVCDILTWLSSALETEIYIFETISEGFLKAIINY